MGVFPAMLEMTGRSAVVVGGGKVGLRKLHSLLDAGAIVTLIAPDEPRGTVPDEVRIIAEEYQRKHLRGAWLVFACTDDHELNARIAADARKMGALINAADQPADCDFYLAATHREGELLIAVSTTGSSPGLAGKLKRQIAAALPERIGEYTALLRQLRRHIQQVEDDPQVRMTVMKQLSRDENYRLFLTAGPEAVKARAEELLKG
ncbi:MAG: bifunctional precorrin-2 dehydrogenase/sirohydrochlorin ferrochelatase [Phycisphaerae bacterium]